MCEPPPQPSSSPSPASPQQQQSQSPPPLPPGVLPYQTPARPGTGGGITCPRCGQYAARQPSFTWWGGLIGPKMLSHAVCDACGFGFNQKTGKSNTGPI